MTKTREEYLKWCKDRAMLYVERNDYQSAIASIMADLNKHEETKINSEIVTRLGIRAATSGDRSEVVRYIQGFN